MSATQCLRDEHRVISRVLVCFDLVLQQARADQRVDKTTFAPFVEFFRDYADRCHHAREEDQLFPCMERCHDNEVLRKMEALREEHVRGRKRVMLMGENLDDAEGGDVFAIEFVLEQGRAFHDMLQGHIAAEDHNFFNDADRILHGDELADLLSRYEDAEADPDFQDRFSRCLELADQICRTHGRSLKLS